MRRKSSYVLPLGLLVVIFWVADLHAAPEHLDFPQTSPNLIEEEDMQFCRSLAAQAHPSPPIDGWQGPLKGAPDGMLVWGKEDPAGDSSSSSAVKFFILGSIANVSAEAVIATVEGTDFAERVRWDPSCLVLSTLARDGEDDIVHWKTDFPWPLSDREFVYRRRLQRDSNGGPCAYAWRKQARARTRSIRAGACSRNS
jgi:hypothetical protein